MNTEILIPTIHGANICVHGVTTAKTNIHFDWHIHNECEMYLCLDGKEIFYVHGKEYALTKGDIFFVNEYVPHKTFTYKGTTGFLIQFSADSSLDETNKLLRRHSNFSGCSEFILKSGTEANASLHQCLIEIIEENTHRQKAYTQHIKAAMQKIIAILYRNGILYEPEEFLQNKQLIRFLPVIEYINVHCCEKLSLSDVSSILHIDNAHFCRIFKEAMNTSFIKYLNFVRICKAEKLLLETDKTISEISAQTGFSSPSYFTETFKQNKFCSPLVYRKMKKR
ncbi:MAG: helix-turn-helix transcriptional regulator [Clostridia bacterium]|nr:helix-turn-helix transcriptional regulator [Clostridia bacterium]